MEGGLLFCFLSI